MTHFFLSGKFRISISIKNMIQFKKSEMKLKVQVLSYKKSYFQNTPYEVVYFWYCKVYQKG